MKRVLLFILTVFVVGNIFSQEDDYTHWQISLDGGWSYRIAETRDASPEMKSYLKGLKSGYIISGKGVYYFNKFVGAGLNVSVSRYYNEADKITESLKPIFNSFPYTDTFTYFNISNNITISYAAPCVGFRVIATEKHSFLFDASVGVLWYKEKGYANSQAWEKSESTLGIGIGTEYSYSITKNIAVGVKMSLLSGNLTSYTLQMNNGYKQKMNLDSDRYYENLSQFNLSAGVRFNF